MQLRPHWPIDAEDRFNPYPENPDDPRFIELQLAARLENDRAAVRAMDVPPPLRARLQNVLNAAPAKR